MKRPVTLIAATAAGLAGFGWTLGTYRAPNPEVSWGRNASYNPSPNHWNVGPKVDPAERVSQLKDYLEKNPGDARIWHRLGLAQHRTGDQAAALASWAKAAELQATTPPEEPREQNLYNLACYRALAGDRDGALTAWAGCVDAGWDDPGFAAQDSDLDSIRDDSRFLEAFKKIVPRPEGTVRLGAG